MGLSKLCFVAALAATLSFALAGCNGGGDPGIPMTPGAPDAGSGPEMPEPAESMTPGGGEESAEPAPLGTPVAIAPNGPPSTPAPSASPAAMVRNAFQPSRKPEERGVTMTMRTNDKKIPAGGYLWFESTFTLRGAVAASFGMEKSKVRLAGHTYNGPAAIVNVMPGVKTAAIQPSNETIVSTIPSTTSGKSFMNGLIVYLPAGLPAHQTVTWTATFHSLQQFTNGAKIQWQTSATAYSHFATSYKALRIKPLTGAPERFAKNVAPGGAATATQNVTICPCLPRV